jgi:DNA-binding NtrC family response regulator
MDKADPVAVLVIEDEPLILSAASLIIQEAGFKVYEARNADAAIALLEKHVDIRILFTDIDMPGSMNGLKLAAAVRNRWPPVEIIVTSGAVKVTADQIPERGVFLPKPYALDHVVATLQRMAA